MPRKLFPVFINAPGEDAHGEVRHVTSVTRMEGLANKSFTLKHPETGEKLAAPEPANPSPEENEGVEEGGYDFAQMTKGQLLTLAIENDIEGANSMNKEDLIVALVEANVGEEEEEDETDG
ncbi:MAG: hypothetical protein CMJ75_18625 [Planctomycetaceae bacterium]|nr:hypothetical protein [Planctomycetaceae bacterium]